MRGETYSLTFDLNDRIFCETFQIKFFSTPTFWQTIRQRRETFWFVYIITPRRTQGKFKFQMTNILKYYLLSLIEYYLMSVTPFNPLDMECFSYVLRLISATCHHALIIRIAVDFYLIVWHWPFCQMIYIIE